MTINILALNSHWYNCTHDRALETHLSLIMQKTAGRGGTRSSFEKLRTFLSTVDSENGFSRLKHIKFSNFLSNMTKTVDILNGKKFHLETVTVQTSTIGSHNSWKQFVEKHCQGSIRAVHMNAVRSGSNILNWILNLKTLTEIRLIDCGPLNPSMSWGSLTSLKVFDIFFATKSAESMNSAIVLSKLSCMSKLQRLQLANISIDERNLERAISASGGFPDLEKISLRRSFAAQQINVNSINVLLFLLKNANKLRVLDLQGCSSFDMADVSCALGPLASRPTLEELDVSQCDGKYGLGEMFDCHVKPNLAALNLSSMKGAKAIHFDQFILDFVNGNMNLKSLDIGRSPITERQILQIITGRNGLDTLDLTGCYSAPRGWRQMVRRNKFSELSRRIQQLM